MTESVEGIRWAKKLARGPKRVSVPTGDYQIKIKTRVRGGMAIASVTLPRKKGKPIRLTARVPLDVVKRMMRKAQLDGEYGDDLGWGFFKKIVKSVKKVAKKIVHNKMVKTLQKVANNKYLKHILPPQVTASLAVLKVAQNITRGAKAGDPKARAVVERARAQAAYRKSRNPRTRRRFRRAVSRGRALVGTRSRHAYKVTAPSGRVYRTMVSLAGVECL